MNFTTIISTQDLADHIRDTDWVIIDCRFDLTKPNWGHANYLETHIPGAVYAHLDDQLASPVTPESGRHPLPDPAKLAQQFSDWGIDASTQVVVYDTVSGSLAGRLWWLLRLHGHRNVAVLDGGFPKWVSEQRPVASGEEKRTPRQFVSQINPALYVGIDEVEQIREDPQYRLIDARAPERFHGEKETIDVKAGHIPGAINRFYGLNLSADGTFLPAEVLRAQFQELLGDIPVERAVIYCGSGVTSTHHIIAMEYAGLPGARLYPGSWSEWIRDPNRPIAKA